VRVKRRKREEEQCRVNDEQKTDDADQRPSANDAADGAAAVRLRLPAAVHPTAAMEMAPNTDDRQRDRHGNILQSQLASFFVATSLTRSLCTALTFGRDFCLLAD
jgi:hypothetical protein